MHPLDSLHPLHGHVEVEGVGVMDQAPLRRGGIFPDTVVRCFIRITSKLTFSFAS